MAKENDVQLDENQIIALRREKLAGLRQQGVAYPNDFHREQLAADLHQEYDEQAKEWFEENPIAVSVAGRIMLNRLMGKAGFATIQDMSGRVQLYLKKDTVGDAVFEAFKGFDMGDIVGAKGTLFKTKTGELSVRVEQIQLLTKSLRPLPDKFHGLADQELRYRKRYLDLLVNESSRRIFQIRTQLINGIRQYLMDQGFLEVETPMMQTMAGGAAAKPFVTHHNALDMPLYLRIAPELYLKRLVVGGVEKVFEINRNFRNEGVSTRHNPEFTMLEFYQAYANYEDLMNLTEDMFRQLSQSVLGQTRLDYQGASIDFAQPFTRMTLFDAILEHNPDITAEQLNDKAKTTEIARKMDIAVRDYYGLGKLQVEIFEKTVEEKLVQPTFITAYPAEVSPLARRNDENPFITDRFELFIAGREIANGFSELNDPEDQAERFKAQSAEKAAGDEEAMPYDTDYIEALEYGLPPTAGEGIGIDRLAMLFTDSASIRDVLLFPHMRQKA